MARGRRLKVWRVGMGGVSVAVVVFAAACTVPNPAYCDETRPCSLVDAPYCDLSINTCTAAPDASVEPDASAGPDASSGVDSGLPACDAGAGCACADHEACASDVCDRAAEMCIGEDDVIYVDGATGDDTGSCGDRGSPCETIQRAVDLAAGTRRNLRVRAGTYPEALAISGKTVVVIGEVGTIVTPTVADVPALHVEANANVAIDQVTFTGANGEVTNFAAHGIACNASDLSLSRVTVSDNLVAGIQAHDSCAVTIEDSTIASNGVGGVIAVTSVITMDGSTIEGNTGQGLNGGSSSDVTIRGSTIRNNGSGVGATLSTLAIHESTITGNAGGGVSAGNAALLILQRSTVSDNAGGGVQVDDSSFDIANAFITSNGGAGSFGGVRIAQSAPRVPRMFVHNTVAMSEGGTDANGVYCDASTTLASNIVYSEFGIPVAGTCTWSYSNVPGVALGGTNIEADPMFVNEAAGNFHLKMGSPSRNTADPASPTTVDFDGDTRPLGGRADMGADEVVE